eukprot:TRINITY_DN65056_c0_g1_i1.p1 TRINITY_DN65056_c0_g1~~TRINITY_DN65056_c0_g1_i1.p1  ORF type:complete len:238 (-),score=12.39 TRINITY_DN65056_c0_g1_i1:86-799(-)
MPSALHLRESCSLPDIVHKRGSVSPHAGVGAVSPKSHLQTVARAYLLKAPSLQHTKGGGSSTPRVAGGSNVSSPKGTFPRARRWEENSAMLPEPSHEAGLPGFSPKLWGSPCLPKFSVVPRDKDIELSPGPSDYTPRHGRKSSQGSFPAARRWHYKQQEGRSPGPGSYWTTKRDVDRGSASLGTVKFSNVPRWRQTQAIERTPGPASYWNTWRAVQELDHLARRPVITSERTGPCRC